MSQHVAIEAYSRINAAGVALFDSTAMPLFQSAMAQLAASSVQDQESQAERRRGETVSAYGYGPSPQQSKPYAFSDGVAIIPVHGMLLNRFSYGWGFVTGYQFIRGLANAAADDEDVRLIVYDINSYGGEAAGCFELAADLAEISTRKPTLAMIDSAACSAAYAVACVQRKIVSAPSATSGSIGVIAAHIDVSGAMEQAGVKMTLIALGPQKTAGNPYEALSDEAKADIEERVQLRYDMFVEMVAEARSSKGLDDGKIRGTESRSYLASQALPLNLIDAVQTPSEAVSEFLAELGDDDPADEPVDPTQPDDEEQQTGDREVANITEAERDAAVAKATKDGATAERERISAIMGLPEAKTRPALAAKLAAKEGMSAADAKELLEAAAEEPKSDEKKDDDGKKDDGKKDDGKKDDGDKGGDQQSGKGAFREAMEADGGAGVGPNGGDGKGGKDKAGQPSRAERALMSAGFGGKRK